MDISNFADGRLKPCAYKGCTKQGIIRLKILLGHKDGIFCERCAAELKMDGLVQEGWEE